MIVDIQQAKARLSELMERVKGGEEIILTEAGTPCARLVAFHARRRELGFVEGHVPDSFFEPLLDNDLDAWQTSS